MPESPDIPGLAALNPSFAPVSGATGKLVSLNSPSGSSKSFYLCSCNFQANWV
jgi:hypothetical protein